MVHGMQLVNNNKQGRRKGGGGFFTVFIYIGTRISTGILTILCAMYCFVLS